MEVEWVPGDWRTGVDPQLVEEKLRSDTKKSIKLFALSIMKHQPGQRVD